MSRSVQSTTTPIRRGARDLSLGAAALACAAAAIPATAAHATAAGAFKAIVPFSGGRTTDIRIGEPLEFAVKGEKISKVCWSPAPLQHDACSTDLAAPAKAGTQKFTVTLKNGKTLHESVHVGPRARTLPASVDAAGAPGARVVEYEATCTVKAHATVTRDGHLKGTVKASADLQKGDLLAAFYSAGGHAVLALPYKWPAAPVYYFNGCLTRVR